MPSVSSATSFKPTMPRGVYRAPYLTSRGLPFIVAVASNGREIAVQPYSEDSDEQPTRARLREILEEADPVQNAA